MLISYACDLLFSLPLAMRPPGPLEIGIIIFILLPLHFLPAIIAFARNTDDKITVLLLNLFLGWTFIVWVIALVMAFSQKKEEAPSKQIVASSQHKKKVDKYCSKCGSKIDMNIKYCPECGVELKIDND